MNDTQVQVQDPFPHIPHTRTMWVGDSQEKCAAKPWLIEAAEGAAQHPPGERAEGRREEHPVRARARRPAPGLRPERLLQIAVASFTQS